MSDVISSFRASSVINNRYLQSLYTVLPTSANISTANQWTEDSFFFFFLPKIHLHHFLHSQQLPACRDKVWRLMMMVVVVGTCDYPEALWLWFRLWKSLNPRMSSADSSTQIPLLQFCFIYTYSRCWESLNILRGGDDKRKLLTGLFCVRVCL